MAAKRNPFLNAEFIAAYRFFRAHAGGLVGHSAARAFALAKAENRATWKGLTVEWENDDMPWDGDCEAPKHVLCGFIRDNREGRRYHLASLGGVGVNDSRDPYLRVVAAELCEEAFDALDDEEPLVVVAKKALRRVA